MPKRQLNDNLALGNMFQLSTSMMCKVNYEPLSASSYKIIKKTSDCKSDCCHGPWLPNYAQPWPNDFVPNYCSFTNITTMIIMNVVSKPYACLIQDIEFCKKETHRKGKKRSVYGLSLSKCFIQLISYSKVIELYKKQRTVWQYVTNAATLKDFQLSSLISN